MQPVKRTATVGVLFFGMAAVLLSPPPQPTVQAHGDGQTVFKTSCTLCHGGDGSGKTPVGQQLKVRDLRSGDVQKQSDAQLATTITKGKGKMPPFEKSLNQAQVKELVAFIRQLSQKR